MGDLSPDLERCAAAMSEAFDDALDLATCQGDTRDHPPRPVWDKRPAPPDDFDTWIEYAVTQMLRVALAVRAQCGTCGGTGQKVNTMPASVRSEDGSYEFFDIPTAIEVCPSCGGAPLPVLVESTRLERVMAVATGIVRFPGEPSVVRRDALYRLRDQEGDEA